MIKYVAFLRGINVSGHHKVPMADLIKDLEKLRCKNVITILNSGNVIFESSNDNLKDLEKLITDRLEKSFGFSIPTILLKAENISQLIANNPFSNFELTKYLRFYISFLMEDVDSEIQLPWSSEDNSYKILVKEKNVIASILDLSITNTPKAMKALEQYYGKNITTRNWNTINRIEKKF